MPDILKDYRKRLAARISDQAILRVIEEVEHSIRQEYAGDRIYIVRDHERRDRSIYRDWQDGERPALLHRRYGLSLAHIHRILDKQKKQVAR